MNVREKTVMGMAEYIEREAAIKELMNDAPEQVGYSREDAADCIRYMDTADVVPVVHGHFVHDGPRFAHGVDWWHCSNCGRLASGVETRFDYCPWCGARMDAI